MARALARRRRSGLLAVVFLAAVTVAVGGGGLAAARRTITAHPRLLDGLASADAFLGAGNPDEPEFGYVDPARIAELDAVEAIGVARIVIGGAVDADGRPIELEHPIGLVIPLDDHIFRDVGEVPLRTGRLPRADEPDAVAVSNGVVKRFGVGIGDQLTYAVLTFEQAAAIGSAPDVRAPEVTRLRVVGTFGPTELAEEGTDPVDQRTLIGSRALLDARPGAGAWLAVSMKVRGGPAGLPALNEQLRSLGGDGAGGRADVERAVRRAVGPEATAVLLFGLAALAAGVLMTAQAVGRQSLALAAEGDALAALGLARRDRAVVVALPVAASVTLGVAAGVAGAWLASGLAPVGLARAFEPDPPLRFEPVLAAGAGAVLLLLWAATAAHGWRAARVGTEASRARVARSTGPIEVRLARGLAMTSVETRRLTMAAVAGAGLAVVTLIAVSTFSTSLHRLVGTPRLYGQDFDLRVWDGYGVLEDDVITAALRDTGTVAAISRERTVSGSVEGRETSLAAYDPAVVGPVVTSGRLPAAAGEVLLGRRLASRLGRAAGDRVAVEAEQRSGTYEVVGTGVLPDGGGNGALFTVAGLRRVAPDADIGWQYARLDAGASVDRARRSLLGRFEQCALDCDVVVPSPPVDVERLDRVGNLPALLAAVLAVLGIAGTTHALFLVTRSGRRPLALVRAMGGTTGLLVRSVLTQVTLIGLTALALGVPLGWTAGRLLWARFTDALGVVPGAAVPVAAAAVLVAALLVTTHALALGPAWRAARRAPAASLRTE